MLSRSHSGHREHLHSALEQQGTTPACRRDVLPAPLSAYSKELRLAVDQCHELGDLAPASEEPAPIAFLERSGPDVRIGG